MSLNFPASVLQQWAGHTTILLHADWDGSQPAGWSQLYKVLQVLVLLYLWSGKLGFLCSSQWHIGLQLWHLGSDVLQK